MTPDAEKGVFHLSSTEAAVIWGGNPGFTREWPLSDARGLLRAIEAARGSQLDQIDLSEYPAGVARSQLTSRQINNQEVLREAVASLAPYLPSPVADIEKFLEGH